MFALEMKQVFHKIVSLLMAFVVLFSTMSFTIDMHYCGDILVDTAIFNSVKSCGMETQDTETKDCSVVKKNCCSEKQIVFEGQDELKISFDNLNLDQQLFIALFVHSYLNVFETLEVEQNLYNTCSTPKVVRQLYKLDETYLI